ncbi:MULTISPECIES: hypothetical protein [Kordiimonas]|jgi:serralysin|uniref:hypothetical protein n=1 Tax=Kordiimonas TaxID=288021 RepID=UPI00257E2F65|nr:hypothetical protein [Kordiimonas sp. UBA4487]
MPGTATDNVHDVTFFGPSGNQMLDSMLFGFQYSAEEDQSYQVTFSIPGEGAVFNDEYPLNGVDVSDNFFPVTDQMADWFREAAASISSFSGLTLTEVADNGANFGHIRLAGTTDLPDNMGAGVFGDADAFHLNRTGDIFFDDRALDFDQSFLQRVVIHELGHAIGLAHPGEGFAEAFTMPAEFDGDEYTIMDTNFDSAFFSTATSTNIYPSTYMYADILAIQHMYGVNPNANAGNTTYTFDLSEDHYMTLYDLGGTDTIEILGTKGSIEADSVIIDLSVAQDSLGGQFIDVGTTVSYFDGSNQLVGQRDQTVYVSPETRLENVTTAAGNDIIVGNDLSNVLKGGDGDDIIVGDAGNDTLVGGQGNDIVAGGDGNDFIWAGPGDIGADIVSGDNGNDIIAGGGGNDTLAGGVGADIVFGGSGDDLLVAHGWNDGIATTAETAANQLWAGSGDDRVFGAGGADQLGGGDGDDTIDGGGGNDTIYAGRSGADNLAGGAGTDVIFGGSDNDTVSGGAGADELYGGVGDDIVSGGAGTDTLYGGAGDDTLNGGDGDDMYRAGGGADVLVFESGHGDDRVSGFELTVDTTDLSETFTNFTDLASVQAAATETAVDGTDGLLLDTGGGDSIFFIGLTIADLTTMDILF